MRYFTEFLVVVGAMIMALLAFVPPSDKKRGPLFKYSILLVAGIICLASLLYRGFTGSGVDDLAGRFLVDQACQFIDLRQCVERNNDKRKIDAETKRASDLSAATQERDRKAAEEASQRELELIRLKVEVDAAKRAALDAERQQFAAQKLASEKADEARRLKDAEEARLRALARLPQMKNGKLTTFSALRVRLNYESTPNGLQAGRGVRQVISRLNGIIVHPNEPTDVEMNLTLQVARSEGIGFRHAEVTLSLDCNQPRANSSCFSAPLSANGNGDGPHFDAAMQRAIDDAISALEQLFARTFVSRH